MKALPALLKENGEPLASMGDRFSQEKYEVRLYGGGALEVYAQGPHYVETFVERALRLAKAFDSPIEVCLVLRLPVRVVEALEQPERVLDLMFWF